MDALPERETIALVPHLMQLLRVPPFPGARIAAFTRIPGSIDATFSLDQVVARIVEKRVGGCFWAAQPVIPQRYFLVRAADNTLPDDWSKDVHGEPLVWPADETRSARPGAVSGACDPWHMLAGATGVQCAADDEVRTIAGMLNIPVYVCGGRTAAASPEVMAPEPSLSARFASPFGREPMSIIDVIDLLGFWRELIDANRDIAGGLGFAFWKRESVLPLLWNGGDRAGFALDSATVPSDGKSVALWRAKAPPELVARLEQAGTPMVEVEDGFLRSAGLGADCVPPLSITVDRRGPHFDPAQPSELEVLLQQATFDAATIERARAVRQTIVDARLGKYGRGGTAIGRFDPARRHVLVPGQVEDDRSVLTGGCGLTTNAELLRRVRDAEPEAFIVYKPHPDVAAGHRKGTVSERDGRLLADMVVSDQPISSLIDMVDEVHVNTSLAGFEALMRGKPVTIHGVPFYAGWGLTRDLGPVPARRTRQRSLDELVAATLLLYPRYLDPESGLPCPVEVVVDRLTNASHCDVGVLVKLRRAQGRVRRHIAAWTAWTNR